MKDEMTGRVDIIRRTFEKTAKKVKVEVKGPKKVNLWTFLMVN